MKSRRDFLRRTGRDAYINVQLDAVPLAGLFTVSPVRRAEVGCFEVPSFSLGFDAAGKPGPLVSLLGWSVPGGGPRSPYEVVGGVSEGGVAEFVGAATAPMTTLRRPTHLGSRRGGPPPGDGCGEVPTESPAQLTRGVEAGRGVRHSGAGSSRARAAA